ncbi:MAG: methyl-accepting chemotaxis protein [Gammaproteobacteria bacterium]|nr:methyl-accepting chemotaxis protein [Gammaproteobacteria bacterium]QOJ33179.1 MAG: methyl-accepting chemotaxis protein [Gammaproteobacteria bacterium]
MFNSSNRSRNLVILALCMFLSLVGTMALVFKGPGASGAGARADADIQAALVQAREALRGSPQAFDALARTVARMDAPGSGDADPLAGQVRASAAIISKGRPEILGAYAVVADLEKLIPPVRREAEELQFAAGGQAATGAQLQRLGTIMQGIVPQVRALVSGPAKPTDVANALGQTEIDVAQIILGLQSGDPDLNLKAVSGARATETLGRLAAARDKVFTRVRDARALGDRLDLISQASRQLDQVALRVVSAPAAATGSSGAPAREVLVIGLLVLAAVILAAMTWVYFQAPPAGPVQPATDQADRNQQAILRLLDELSSLADGDLTVQATVTEDITGAIADSINYAVEALRELVTTINESAILLDGAARSAETTAAQLGQASEAQSKQVESASQAIGRMVGSIEEVSGDAERSSDVARHSVDVAHKGGEAVRRTIEGMNAIRETIQDTSKRIKRLGESSQEIGNIVELINDIADQTNILALNASIQASMAGEAGRGFAVVADEVQRLAERSANATKQIEVLVRTIQADTNEAIVSMERSTTDVVGGALLAENAGAALEEIEQVSSQIASLVQNISNSAREQAGAAAAVIRIVELLQQINSQTASGTSNTRESISKLAELAAQLRRSVAGFRLPPGVVDVRPGRGPEPRQAQSPGTEAGGYGERGLRVIGKRTA